MGRECTPSLRKTVGTTPTCSRNVLLKWLNDENPTSPATWVTVSVLPRSKNLARSIRNEVSVFQGGTGSLAKRVRQVWLRDVNRARYVGAGDVPVQVGVEKRFDPASELSPPLAVPGQPRARSPDPDQQAHQQSFDQDGAVTSTGPLQLVDQRGELGQEVTRQIQFRPDTASRSSPRFSKMATR